MTRVIGLTGRARSGKNTVAAMIADLLPVERVAEGAFADAVKVSAARALGVPFTGDDVGIAAVRRWADEFKLDHTVQVVRDGQVLHEITGRSYLQRYGTEAHRELFDPDFWVNVVDLNPDGVDVLVMTDVRFPNEAEVIREQGGEVWQIVGDDSGATDEHASERPLPPQLIDRELVNRGTLDQLRAQVEVALGLVRLV